MNGKTRITDPVSVVVPARNEAVTIGRVIKTMAALPAIDEVIVVDNGSQDNTAEIAAAAGARVVQESRPGMGHAIRAGFTAAKNDWVMKVDADLERFDTDLFGDMVAARAGRIGLIKGYWQNPKDTMPMTRLLVMPAIARLFPGLSGLRAPNSGIYVFDRSLIAVDELTGDYAADLDVMLRVHAAGADVTEVSIGQISHDPRDLGHYNAMAETIMGFFLRQNELRITEQIVVLADRAEQVISASLGVLAAHSRAGGAVTVYLTDASGDSADVLHRALAAFPTARICPLSEAAAYAPGAATTRLRLFAPYPAATEGRAIRAGLRLLAASDPDAMPELLLMPQGPLTLSVDGFKPDVALSVGNGAEIKNTALARLSAHAAEAAAPREVFQSYASLPGPLKQAIDLDPRPEAGIM